MYSIEKSEQILLTKKMSFSKKKTPLSITEGHSKSKKYNNKKSIFLYIAVYPDFKLFTKPR